ncbi:hypothetical protein NXC24_PA00280 (plasmid) [Rhizobium sp. NXC24]|nr:hypothetical protein NXC24_PA00280 [Rhizobium sp. NXC24]
MGPFGRCHLRAAYQQGRGYHPCVQFVGLAAYKAAGGHVTRDLFAEEEGRGTYLDDKGLIVRLDCEKPHHRGPSPVSSRTIRSLGKSS